MPTVVFDEQGKIVSKADYDALAARLAEALALLDDAVYDAGGKHTRAEWHEGRERVRAAVNEGERRA